LEDYEKAAAAFREVVRLTNPRGGRFKNPVLREQAFFSLARTHYSFQQFRAAIFYYERISRDSPSWLDALFESSWAYFRLTDYEKALGNLVTLHSPYFINEYFPESHILKAVTYYENCRYPEALEILEDFEAMYGPLREELDKLTKEAKTPEEYYKLLKDLEKRERTSALYAKLVSLARSDKALQSTTTSARELEAEERRINQALPPMKGTPLQAFLLESVQKRREELAQTAGAIARAKLEAERDELKAQASQLFRIKFEITKREKEGLEASLRGETQATRMGKYKYSVAVPDDMLYWPFEGEYWRDELGTYEYTLSKGCRQ
jgi:tetratricopeptide (TPR) repeat protein